MKATGTKVIQKMIYSRDSLRARKCVPKIKESLYEGHRFKGYPIDDLFKGHPSD